MDRALDYRQLDAYLCSRQRRVTLIQGPTTRRAASAPASPLRIPTAPIRWTACRTRSGSAAAVPGVDVVLLSPGAASYDLFRNYEEKARGTAGISTSFDTL